MAMILVRTVVVCAVTAVVHTAWTVAVATGRLVVVAHEMVVGGDGYWW